MSSSVYSRMISTLLGSQLRRNVASSAASNVVGLVTVLVSYPLYLRYLGFQNYGIWLALTGVLSLAQLGGLGIAPAVTKYVAEESARRDVVAAESYIATANLLLLGSGIVLAAALSMLRFQIAALLGLTSDGREVAVQLIPAVACLSAYILVAQVSSGTLAGVGRTDQLSYIQLSGRVASLLVSWSILRAGGGVGSLLWGAGLSQLAMHCWTEFLIWRNAKLHPLRLACVSYTRMRKMLRFGAGLLGSSVMQLLLHPFNRVLLSRYGGVSSLPVFEIAYSGAMQLRSLLAVALQALLPAFSQASAVGAKPRLESLNRRAWMLIWLGSVPLYATLILVASPALHFWLGARFAPEQVPCFRVMLVGSFISLLGVPAYFYLLGVANVRAAFISQAIQTVVNLGLIYALLSLTNRLSPIILALSVSVSFMGASGWLLVAARRDLMKLPQ